ncbi:esterase/lipase [Bacillus horti]|uniref:Esterase/lipase n=1 Tax=Caldalkalibacillus horti TaxID=77523 RepID=A0ABT9VYQ7_9BACI|nr:esterase/lipase [Bacillus horti]
MITFPKPTIEQFLRTYLISNFAVSRDETKLVYSSNMNGKFNLWALDLPEKRPYQFAQHDQACDFLDFDQDNRFLLAGFDQDGDENFHIYALPFEGGLPQPLVAGDKSDRFFYEKLTKNGEHLYYVTTKDNPSLLNSHRYNIKTGEDELIYKGSETATSLGAVAPEEESFVTTQFYSNVFSISYVHTKAGKVSLTPDPTKVHSTRGIVYQNDSSLFFITDYESEYPYVAHFDIPSQTFTPYLSIENESVTTIKWHEQTRTLWIITEKGVVDHLYAYDTVNEKLIKVDTPVDIIEQLTIADSGTVYILGKSAVLPLNIFCKKIDEQWEALTANRVLGVAEDRLVDPEIVSYSSFDDLEIEALLFRAKEDVANGYTVFWPHGGPQAAERKSYRALFQCLLSSGYNIFAPNFRGSSGYGSTFIKLVERDWGGGPRLDCVAGIEWLFEQGISNREKLFVVGRSYGGYMTLLLAGRHPEYFKAAIDTVGPSNLFSFIESVPEHWKPLIKLVVGDPIEDKKKLEEDSPIRYLDQMKNPIFIIQGANDPRTVKRESDQIVEALKANGVDIEYLVFEDEGHDFAKKENEIIAYKRMIEFLDKHQ